MTPNSSSEELKIFYASVGIYTFAASITQIFIPLYLFEKKYSLELILIFFALSQLWRLTFLPLSAFLSSSFGAKKVIGLSFFFTVIFLLFLQKIDNLSFYFYFSALFFGAQQAFLWIPFLVHQSKISPDKERGKITARLNIYAAIAGALGPFLGGFMISLYGFGAGFALTILLAIPAIILLLLTPEVSKIRKINFKSVKIRKIYPDLIANGFYNFQNQLSSVVWPIFIFIIVPQYKTIGSIQTAAFLISLVAFYFSGKWTDKFNRKKLLLLGSALNSFTGIFRILANSFNSVFLLNAASTFTNTLQSIPWAARLQEHLDADARTEYMAIFEIGGVAITFAGLTLFAALTDKMPQTEILFYGIIVSSLSGLLINLVRK